MSKTHTSNPKRKPRKNRGGRPTRAQASAKALAALAVDPASIDPRSILASIAADVAAPSTARVAACRALIAGNDGEDSKPEDSVTALALRILRKGEKG